MKKTAREYFLQRRGNCAQSVAAAIASKCETHQGAEVQFADHGHGQAPGGTCGALWASCSLADEEKAQNIKTRFMEHSGGHTACRAIRSARSLRCVECVELAAALFEEHSTPAEKDSLS